VVGLDLAGTGGGSGSAFFSFLGSSAFAAGSSYTFGAFFGKYKGPVWPQAVSPIASINSMQKLFFITEHSED